MPSVSKAIVTKTILFILLLLVTACTPSTDHKQQNDQTIQETVPVETTSTTQQPQKQPSKVGVAKTGVTIIPPTTTIQQTTPQTSTKTHFRQNPELPSTEEQEQLPECTTDELFTIPPIDLSKVTEITPRGNLGPPGHTFPTDHSYLHFNPGGFSKETHELIAPSDIHILHIATSTGHTQDAQDSVIYFAVCKDVIGYFNHVKSLSPQIKKIVEESNCADKPHAGPNACLVQVLEPIKQGTLLGEVGARQGNFDFGLIDLRKPLTFAQPDHFPTRSRFMHCPYDYYSENIKQQFYEKIKRQQQPRCGATDQDIPGTLQGNWFHESTTDHIAEWNNHLAFVNDNNHPDIQVVSIGGIVREATKYEFEPQSTGTTNRLFEDVTPSETIYCYHAQQLDFFQNNVPEGKILVQLESDESLLIEYQDGTCNSNNKFKQPERYVR